MTIFAATSTALALLTAATPQTQRPLQTRGPWILTCSVTVAESAQGARAEERTFRVGPQLFQQWDPVKKAFGTNLCAAHRCVADRDRLEGQISSASLVLTISLDPATGAASWRTLGASGFRGTSGPCSVRPETARPSTPGKGAQPPRP